VIDKTLIDKRGKKYKKVVQREKNLIFCKYYFSCTAYTINLPSVFDVFINYSGHAQSYQCEIPTGHEHDSDT
jgi:hypothetical protein